MTGTLEPAGPSCFPALTGADDHRPTETGPRPGTETAGEGVPQVGTDLRVRVVSLNRGMYRVEPVDVTMDRPLFLAVRDGAAPPAVGTELDTWVLRHSANITFVTADDSGRLPISPTMLERYLHAVAVVDELTSGEIPDDVRSRLSELKGMANRCIKLNQRDWVDVWRVLGRPDKPALNRLLHLCVSTNHALKSGTFTPEAFRSELAGSGWPKALAAARETLRQRLSAEEAGPPPQSEPQSPTDTPEPSRPHEQPRQNAPKEPDTMTPTTSQTADPATALLRHLEATVAADRTCKTHEAVRFELMAALLRADRQPENSAIVDVSCVTDTGLHLYEVLGAGRTSHSDLRAGAARLLEIDHALPSKADRLYLVLCEPPAEPWSVGSIRDVFTVEVIWRTRDGWEGGDGRTVLATG
ncbi:hypothetical protein [Streptomyces sp. NPDC127100]|uniref:hypothetical protein n=1 Tax=Streptomyces sp. NPDC127100 TaxID=3347138 RepID=UPI003660C396